MPAGQPASVSGKGYEPCSCTGGGAGPLSDERRRRRRGHRNCFLIFRLQMRLDQNPQREALCQQLYLLTQSIGNARRDFVELRIIPSSAERVPVSRQRDQDSSSNRFETFLLCGKRFPERNIDLPGSFHTQSLIPISANAVSLESAIRGYV